MLVSWNDATRVIKGDHKEAAIMNDNHEQGTTYSLSGFWSGLLIGGLAAGTVVLLTAPQSGKKTRALIRQKSLEMRDQAAETVHEAREQADEALRRARAQGRRMTRRVGATAKEVQQRGEAILEEQKERLQTAIEAIQPS
jgi:gas vesicle protein